jgi:RNase P subunit RPR2
MQRIVIVIAQTQEARTRGNGLMAYVCCRGDFIKFYQEEEREKKREKGGRL